MCHYRLQVCSVHGDLFQFLLQESVKDNQKRRAVCLFIGAHQSELYLTLILPKIYRLVLLVLRYMYLYVHKYTFIYWV